MKTYDLWLTKLRKRAQPSGALSQWAELLAQRQGGDPGMWREHLREILEEEEKASLDLILHHRARQAKGEPRRADPALVVAGQRPQKSATGSQPVALLKFT